MRYESEVIEGIKDLQMLTIKQTSQILSLSKSQILQLIREGCIDAVRFENDKRRNFLVPEKSLEKAIANKKFEPIKFHETDLRKRS